MDGKRRSKARADLRLCAATVGASAVVAMAAIGLMVAQEHEGATAATSTTMNIGSTSTETTPSNAPAVARAQPLMKGPAPLPSEEEAAK